MASANVVKFALVIIDFCSNTRLAVKLWGVQLAHAHLRAGEINTVIKTPVDSQAGCRGHTHTSVIGQSRLNMGLILSIRTLQSDRIEHYVNSIL